MKGSDIFEKLNEIDPDLISKAADDRPERKKQKKIRFKLLIPAAVFALVLGVSAFALGYFRGERKTVVKEDEKESDFEIMYNNDTSENGYTLNTNVGKVQTEELKGAINSANSILSNSFNYRAYNSTVVPGVFSCHFDDPSDAVDYIGYDKLVVPYFPYDDSDTEVNSFGDADGNIIYTEIETNNYSNSVHVQVNSRIVTTNANDDFLSAGAYTTEDLEFTSYSFKTDGGNKCEVVRSSPMKSGYSSITGYLVKDDVLYTIKLAYLPEDKEDAETMLKTWANAF